MNKSKQMKIPSHIAQYKLKGILGSGGMGVVAKAIHVLDGKEVALKILHTPQIGGFGLLREIRAIQKLHHPSVIQLLDSGVQDDLVWYAMELLSASTLRDLMKEDTEGSGQIVSIESTFDVPVSESHTVSMQGDTDEVSQWIVSLQQNFNFSKEKCRSVFDQRSAQRLKYAAQIAHALDYIHARGMIHCDVKPGNVLVTQEGQAVLIDFGLAVQQTSQAESTELLDSGLFFGTILYLSPERLLRQPFDARADLYALGCMMYEMVVGAAPVFYPETDELLGYRHPIQNPRPSFYVDHVPPELDDLITSLVSKNPKDRPGYARNVFHVLSQLGFADKKSAPISSKGYLYPTQYLGRVDIINDLESKIETAISGHGGAAAIQGERGIGKTSLASHIVHFVRAQRITCVTGQSSMMRKVDNASEGQVLSLFTDMFRKIVDRFLVEKNQSSIDAFHAKTESLGAIFPFLGMLPTTRAARDVQGVSAKDSQQKILDEVLWVIEYVSKNSPLVLVFDDIQWADPLSIECLKLLLNRIERKPWFVLLLGEDCSFLDKRENLTRVQLVPLQEEFHEPLIQDMLGRAQFPLALLQYVRNQTKGNPLFVRLCIQAAIHDQYLSLTPEGNWRFDWRVSDLMNASVPESVGEILSKSLQQLSGKQRELCTMLSIFGQETDVLLFAQLMDMDAADLLYIAAKDGVNSIVTVKNEESTSRLDFVHWGVAELLIESLDGHFIRSVHRNIVHLFEHDPDFRKDKVRMARHCEGAGLKERARKLYEEAAQKSTESSLFHHANAMYDKAISLYDTEPEMYRIMLDFVKNVLRPRGLFERADQLLQDVVAHAADSALVMKALNLLSSVKVHVGDFEQAERARQRHWEYCQKSKNPRAICDNLFLEALILLEQHQFDLGLKKLIELQEKIPSSDKALYEIVTSDIAHLHLEFGRYQEAITELHELLTHLERKPRDCQNIRVMASLSLAYMYLGELDEALAYSERSKSAAQEFGLRWLEIFCLGNQGLVYMQRGEFQECISISKDVLLLARDMGLPKAEFVALINILLCRVELAHYTRAKRIIEELLPKERELGPYLYGYILYAIARINRYMNKPEQSVKHIMQGLGLFKRHQIHQPYALLLCEYGHILLAMNSTQELVEDKLKEAQSWREKLGVNEFSELGIAVARLEAAFSAYIDGQELFVGSRREDLPPQVFATLDIGKV